MDSSEMVLTNFPVSSIIVYDSYDYLALNLADDRRITHEKVRRINLRNWLSLPILQTLRIAPLCHQKPGHDPNYIYSLRIQKSPWQA